MPDGCVHAKRIQHCVICQEPNGPEAVEKARRLDLLVSQKAFPAAWKGLCCECGEFFDLGTPLNYVKRDDGYFFKGACCIR